MEKQTDATLIISQHATEAREPSKKNANAIDGDQEVLHMLTSLEDFEKLVFYIGVLGACMIG